MTAPGAQDGTKWRNFRTSELFSVLQDLGTLPSAAGAPGTHRRLEDLRRMLLAWNSDLDASCTHRLHLLGYWYENRELAVDFMEAEDAALLGHLRAVCEELGFKLFLVNMALSTFGRSIQADCCHSPASDTTLEDVDESVLEVTKFVDVIGDAAGIVDCLEVDLCDLLSEDAENGVDDEVDDADCHLQDVFQRGDPPDRELDESSGVHFITHTYRRSGIVFWPPSQHNRAVVKTQGFDALVQRVHGSTAEPTVHDLAAWEAVFDCTERKEVHWVYSFRDHAQPDDAATPMVVLAAAAARWGTFDLWVRAVRSGNIDGNAALLSVEDVMSAVKVLGFERTRPILDEILAKTPRDMCLKLAQKISQLSNGEERSWANQRIAWLLPNVRPPVKTGVE